MLCFSVMKIEINTGFNIIHFNKIYQHFDYLKQKKNKTKQNKTKLNQTKQSKGKHQQKTNIRMKESKKRKTRSISA